jgi:hypothetical protein
VLHPTLVGTTAGATFVDTVPRNVTIAEDCVIAFDATGNKRCRSPSVAVSV